MTPNIRVEHRESLFEGRNNCWFCTKQTNREIKIETETIKKDAWGHDNGNIRQQCISCCEECWPRVRMAMNG